jgi:cell division transport system permease protein
MIVSSLRILKYAFQDFFRNFWLSLATISVLALTLLTVNGLVVINFLGNVALTEAKSKVDIGVHFKPEISEERVQTVKISLMSLSEVKEVEFISPTESLKRFSDKYGNDPLVIESLGEVGSNPFGSTLVIQARSIEGYGRILETLDSEAFSQMVEERDFDDRQEIIGRIEAIARKIEWFGFGASIAIALITLLIVLNTIRVSIYTHRDEIRIMRLVGASNGIIRGPFYVEAVFWSLLAVGLTAGIVLPATAFFQPYIQNFFGSPSVDLYGFYTVNWLKIFGLQFAAVALMSLMTTKLATARYLRV